MLLTSVRTTRRSSHSVHPHPLISCLSQLYANVHLTDGNKYVVRLDENSVEFLAKSGSGYGGCIVNSGDYYIFNSNNIKRVIRPDLLTGYSNPADAPEGLVVDLASMYVPANIAVLLVVLIDRIVTGATQIREPRM